MILLIGVVIVTVILFMTYVNLERAEIQRKQEAFQRERHELDARIKEENRLAKERLNSREYNPQV